MLNQIVISLEKDRAIILREWDSNFTLSQKNEVISIDKTEIDKLIKVLKEIQEK